MTGHSTFLLGTSGYSLKPWIQNSSISFHLYFDYISIGCLSPLVVIKTCVNIQETDFETILLKCFTQIRQC
jgi:hypothetical protein